jgi:hypothetical protein
MADDAEEGGSPPSPLPSSRDDEFRPFVRRLPEWQFWCVGLPLDVGRRLTLDIGSQRRARR